MNIIARGALCAAAFIGLSATAAFAHATLEPTQAKQDSSYRGVVRIGHGCEGTATTTVRVTIPEGVIVAKPMPKAGWTLATTTGAYAKTYPYFRNSVSSGVKEITWSGGRLPDDQYDEFVFVGRITDAFAPGSIVYFPVVQECETGSHRWVEIPASGQDSHALKAPAPGIRILAADTSAEKSYKIGDLTVTSPWARATPAGAKVGGGYARITNQGKQADRLVGASITVAGRTEIHEMTVKDGVMRMQELKKGLEIKPGESVDLKPGGFHLMFMDLSGGLKEGETLKGTLIFEKAGTLPVEFHIAPIGAQGSGESGHRH